MVIKSNKDAFVKLIYFPNSVPVKFIKKPDFCIYLTTVVEMIRSARVIQAQILKRATRDMALSLILNRSFSKDEAIT